MIEDLKYIPVEVWLLMGNLLVGLLVAVIVARLSAKYATLQWRDSEWWKKKVDVYLGVFEAYHKALVATRDMSTSLTIQRYLSEALSHKLEEMDKRAEGEPTDGDIKIAKELGEHAQRCDDDFQKAVSVRNQAEKDVTSLESVGRLFCSQEFATEALKIATGGLNTTGNDRFAVEAQSIALTLERLATIAKRDLGERPPFSIR